MRAPRRSLLSSLLATAVVATGLSTVAVIAAPQASAAVTDIKINEVSSNPSDFVELKNTGSTTVDVGGLRFRDNDATHNYEIPVGTTIPAGGYLVLEEAGGTYNFGFGLGANDQANLFLADGTTVVDSYAWTSHRTPAYGRCPDGTGAMVVNNTTSKGAANICPSPYDGLKINEVESSGGTPGDWIELKNTTAAAIDISGIKLRDNDATHTLYSVPAGTSVAAGGYVVVEEAQLGNGLGSADSAVVFQPDGTTLIDQYDWTSHATTTYGRCPDGTGAFTTTAASTKGAANSCGTTSTDYSSIKVNEVESNGGTQGDWVELKNTGTTTVDISGIKFRDNDTTHTQYAVPAGTTIAPGAYFLLEEAAFGFGLGSADSAIVWQPDGTTAIDQYSWTAHAAITYGRCPDGTGAFADNFSSTKGAANDCFPVKINEVESSGGTPGDWVELRNNGASTADVGGLVFKDNVDTDVYTIPAGTTIAAGGYLVLEEAQFVFGLGGGDSARLYAADGTTLLDSYTWTAHASTTYGRCPNGTGAFTTTQQPTKGAANLCPGDLVTVPWPGGADVTTVDPQNTFASNMSGLMYEPSGTADPGSLWAVRNGPGALFKLTRSGTTWAPTADFATAGKLLHYKDGTGDVDAEGVTFTSAGPAAGIFVASERNNAVSGTSRPAILRYDPAAGTTDLTATNDWNLTADLPGLGANLGLEGIAWVPDTYLTAKGFVDANTSAAYNPATYPNHGTGLFLVGVEQTGNVYAYALDLTSDSYTRVATFASGFPTVMELAWEPEVQQLWVVCDDGCQGRSSRFDVNSSGVFASTAYYERPANMANLNNEGFTLAPRAECVAGTKPVFWSDDSSTGGYAIRQGTVSCTPRAAQTVTITSTAPTSPALGATYAVTATGGASGNPVVIGTSTPAVCTVAGSTVTFAHAGTCTVTASQAGNADNAPGSASQDVVVAKAAQTVTITSPAPTQPTVGATYTVTATGGASGNPVTFAVTTPAVCSITGAVVRFDHAGTCTVTASQAGNADYLDGSASRSITVAQAAQTVVFTSTPPSGAVVGASYTVAATGGASGNPVTFASTTPAVCSVTGTTVALEHGGTCTVRASQAGNADYLAGTATQNVTVGKLVQTVAFTSTPPAAPVVGQTYPVTATGGASGNPVTFAALTDTCTVDGGTVTIVTPGECQVLASQAANADYQAGGASQTVTAVKASSSVVVEVSATDLTATVSVVAPGAAPVDGVVTFTVDGQPAGSAAVQDGVATVAYAVPAGATHVVEAAFSGSDLLTSSSTLVERRDPLISAELTSSAPQSASGWWSAPVTVTFTCTPQGSPVADCPEPVVLPTSGAGQSAVGQVTAADGGVGRVVVDGIDVDLVAPAVRIAGVSDGATYKVDAPAPRCVSSDALSGIASCRLTSFTSRLVTTVTAVATDEAGNTSTTTVRWRRPTLRVAGALRVTNDGSYVLERGRTYRLTALLAAAPQPRALTPVRRNARFDTPGVVMKRGATVGGLVTWGRTIRITDSGPVHKVAVQVGARRVIISLRAV